MEGLINLGFTLLPIVLGYAVGRHLEGKHLASIRVREAATQHVMAVPLKTFPGVDEAFEARLVQGAIVVSIDYFKRVAGQLRGIFGGAIGSYESVIDRARREAVLRMKEDALGRGCHAIICVRIETSRLASSRGNGKGTAGMELVAYGTGVRLIGS